MPFKSLISMQTTLQQSSYHEGRLQFALDATIKFRLLRFLFMDFASVELTTKTAADITSFDYTSSIPIITNQGQNYYCHRSCGTCLFVICYFLYLFSFLCISPSFMLYFPMNFSIFTAAIFTFCRRHYFSYDYKQYLIFSCIFHKQ